ncbi:MAG TPA: hypothetical protein VNS58_28855 [Puia sp.]|nr:hypothetical protein [Puia sp.]
MRQSINILRQMLNNSKKAALLIALFLTVGISYSFASGTDDVSNDIRTSFRKDFKNAQIINSEVHKKFTKLTISMNNTVFFAFYAENGKLLAVTRNILSSQLPLNLMFSLKGDHKGYWISELFELNGEGQNCYYVTLENADSKLTLRSTGDNTWEVYEETAKY